MGFDLGGNRLIGGCAEQGSTPFTRSGTEEPAAAFIFSEERCRPMDPRSVAFLKALGFSEEEAEILLLVLELDAQVAARVEAQAEAKSSKP